METVVFMRYWIDTQTSLRMKKNGFVKVCRVTDIKPLTDTLRHLITLKKEEWRQDLITAVTFINLTYTLEHRKTEARKRNTTKL